MVTIKDIAKYTELSPSTVSIVLRGLSEKRNISDATKKKVLDAARTLGYTPNMQSKLLRSNLPNLPVITLFWDSSTRQYILTRFLKGLQDSIINNGYNYDLLVKPFSIDHLEESITARTLMGSNGIIICNTSEKDMEYLENADLSVPIVLYNRDSSKYPTVTMDDEEIGSLAAQVFVRHGKKHPVILSSKANFPGMTVREKAFSKAFGLKPASGAKTFLVEDTPTGGYNGALDIIGKKPLPDCILCSSDNIAYGALKAFYDKGIKLPGQIELISIGNGNREHEEYSIPSLSVISLPMEAMADACLARITRAITDMNLTPDTRVFHAEYIARESCPF